MDTQEQTALSLPPIPVSSIPDRFFIDVAVGTQSFEDICALYDLDPDAAEALEDDPAFNQRLLIAKQAVEDDGRAFRARCRTIVHNSVGHMEQLMRNPETPASTQLETFKTLVKYGEMEPFANKEVATGPQLSLTIIAPDGSTGFSVNAGVNSSTPSESSGNADDVIDVTPAEFEEILEKPLRPAAPEELEGFF